VERIKGMTMADFEGQESSFTRTYEVFDKKKNANKFWRIYVFGAYVVRHHGRHGSKGLYTVHRAYAAWQARGNAAEIADKKYSTGYRPEASVLDRFAREF
jgi:predicted DNA-binding WGR domain protein